jgi:predicted ATPase
MRSDLPSGTVTFLFTDVEGSTKLLHELGEEAYADALAEHRLVLRETFARHGGVEVDTQGDAFFYAFPSAQGALQAASEGQEALDSGTIRVRLGLHTGSPLLTEEGYVGHDVHFAARVGACGHGGQILLSKDTASLLDGAPLTSLGSHRLKDVAEPVTIFQLGERSFPRLKTIANSNLPTPASSFLGRENELYEADLALHETRLLTVTGPGGAGKTRFALELATRAREERFGDYEDGIYAAFLSSLRDPELVPVTICVALGVREEPAESALEALASHLRGKHVLLLLDNLEHLPEAIAGLSTVLSHCPGLTLLCTSRERLRLQGERAYELPPLDNSESASLFSERSGLEPSEAIAELCARLEGLPLAIELAAARTSVLKPEQIATRLSQRLDLLKGGPDRDPRQETLRATIDWSYDLLSEEEQRLFTRLSVFFGGCTLEAAEEVAEADLDTLQALVEKSLARFTDDRYWMLETIREYASGRLHEGGEADDLRERHLAWMLSLAADADRGLVSPEVGIWLDRIDGEIANLRAALELARETGRPNAQLALVTRTGNYWYTRGLWREAQGWVEDGLQRVAPDRSADRAKALASATVYALVLGDFDVSGTYGNEALSIFRELGDDEGVGWLLNMLGARASELGDFDEAERLFRESRVFARKADDRPRLALATGNLGEIAARRGRYEEAVPLIEEALALARERGRDDLISAMLQQLAVCELELDRLHAAGTTTKEAMELASTTGDLESLTTLWPLVATLAARGGLFGPAAQLLGFGDAQCREIGRVLTGSVAELREAAMTMLHEEIDDSSYAAAAAEGERFSLDEAVAVALDALPETDADASGDE